MIETEQERKVREYWARAYDVLIKNKDKDSNKSLPYEPTAVLTSNPKERKFRLRDIINLDFSRRIRPIIKKVYIFVRIL
jgi:hypothetical protein